MNTAAINKHKFFTVITYVFINIICQYLPLDHSRASRMIQRNQQNPLLMNTKYYLEPDVASGELRLHGFLPGESIPCENYEDALKAIQDELNKVSDSKACQDLMDFLKDVMEWYTTKQPLFVELPEESDIYDIISMLETILTAIDELSSQIQHKQIWLCNPERRPFVYCDTEDQSNTAWVFLDEFSVYAISIQSLLTATQDILGMAQKCDIPPEITAKLMKDLEEIFPTTHHLN